LPEIVALPPETPVIAPVVILVRPQMAENIGMCARAMGNFGLSDLRLVAPRDGWPQKTRMKKGAWQAASGAAHILDQAQLFETVAEAIGDLNRVFATTARERGQAKPVLGADGAAAEMLVRGRAGERAGILFGPERTGLDNDDVSLADTIITFPVEPRFASVNLAQAVLLTGYEWYKAATGAALPFAAHLEAPPARREAVTSFFDFLEQELDSAGYFSEGEKRHVMARNLRNIFHRVELHEQDVRTLRRVVRSLADARQRRG
jgi:tRNA/rRNA methyltransferase